MRHVLLFFSLLLALAAPGWASHLRGGDLTYSAVPSTTAGVPRYHLRLRTFVENVPSSIAPTTVAEIKARRGSCAASLANTLTINLSRTQLQGGVLTGCSTTGSLYDVAWYEGDVDLPADAWLLTYEEAARASIIQNITNPASATFSLSTFLNNSLAPQNNPPRFESEVQPYLGYATLARQSFSAFDVDGDSLRYEAVLPQTTCGTAAVSTLSPHYQVNAASGEVTATVPSGQAGGYNLTVKVSEYRRLNGVWTLIGYVMRDTTYLLYNTPDQPPMFTSMQVNGGASQPPATPIAVQAGQLVGVTLTATDPDAGQPIRFASAAPAAVPGLSLTPVGSQQVRLSWDVPATLPPGRYNIAVAVVDNGCTYNASQEQTLTFLVGPSQPLGVRAGAAGLAAAYPTPFREQVQFAAPAGQAVLVLDALGRAVAHLQAGPDGLVRWAPAPGLPPGLYLARAADAGTPLARLLRAE